MNRPEHFNEAERLLASVPDAGEDAALVVALSAICHALLASVAYEVSDTAAGLRIVAARQEARDSRPPRKGRAK